MTTIKNFWTWFYVPSRSRGKTVGFYRLNWFSSTFQVLNNYWKFNNYTARHKKCTLLTGTITLQNIWHIDAHENILLPTCLTVFVKSKTWEPAYQICYCLLSSRQQRKMWNSCCNARLQTSLLQTYGLMNWSGFWLKRGLASSSVADQTIDQWRVHLNACVKAKGKHFENMMCCSTTVNNLLWNLHSVIFCFTTFNQSWNGCWTIFGTFIGFHTVKNTWSAIVKFLHRFVTNTFR